MDQRKISMTAHTNESNECNNATKLKHLENLIAQVYNGN